MGERRHKSGGLRNERPSLLLVAGEGIVCGVTRHLRHLVSTLDEDYRITVLHNGDEGGFSFLERSRARGVVRDGLKTRVSWMRLLGTWRMLHRLARDGEYDLIWVHAPVPMYLLRMGFKKPIKSRILITYHGLPFEPGKQRWQNLITRFLEKLVLRFGPCVSLVVLSEGAKKLLRDKIGAALHRHRVRVLPNSSDLEPLPNLVRAPGPQILMTTRVSWQKNVAAAVKILSHLPDAKLRLCGLGTDAPQFKAKLGKIVGDETLARVQFLGVVDDIRPYLAQSDLYLMTSRYEGMSIGALEAFQAGLALAAPPDLSDLLDTHPLSVAIDPSDTAGAAHKIHHILKRYRADPAFWSAQIQSSWSTHYDYESWQDAVRKLVWEHLAPSSADACDPKEPVAISEGLFDAERPISPKAVDRKGQPSA